MRKLKINNKLILTCLALLVFIAMIGNAYAQSSGQDSVTVSWYTSADGWWEYVYTGIPTLSQWGLLILILAIAGFSVYMIMRRRRVSSV